MSKVHFIYLTGTQAIFIQEDGASLTLTSSISRGHDDADALDRFTAHLKRYPKDEFVIIADSVSEELVVEDVPKLRPRDLRQMMARRIEQRTRERKLATWQVPPRRTHLHLPLLPAKTDASAPGNDPGRSVVMSLLGPDVGIQPWLDAAVAAQARIAEVLSPALLATGLARRLRRDAENGLIVTVTPAGLRQTLIFEGQVRFTRLARLLDASADSESIAAECTRTIQYLLMNQMLTRQMLTRRETMVWIVTDGIADPERLPPRLKADTASDVEVRRIRAIDLGARRLKSPGGLAIGATPLWADARLISQAGRGYATSAMRSHSMTARLARAVVTAGLAISTIGALLLGGVEVSFVLGEEPTDPGAARRTQEHRELAALLEKYAVPGTEMRRIVELDKQLRQQALAPVEPLRKIAGAVGEIGEVRIERLSWARGAVAAAADSSQQTVAVEVPEVVGAVASSIPGAPPDAGPVVALAGAATGATGPGELPAGGIAAAPDPTRTIDFRIEGRIDPLGRKSSANASATRFVAALTRQCNCTAALLTPPFDPAAGSGFSADLHPGSTNSKGEFVVALQYPTGERHDLAR